MRAAAFFRVLETRSCEIYTAKIAKVGYILMFILLIKTEVFRNSLNKNHMPDFFILFFYATLLCSSILPDATIGYALFVGGNMYLFALFIATILFRIILEIYLEEKSPHEYIPEGIRKTKAQLIFYFCGAGSLVICRKILLETYSSQGPAVKRSTIIQNISFRIFHISKDNIHFIKMYFFINLIFKSFPQLIILPIVLLHYSPREETRIAAMTSILISIAVFSATVTLIFPVRDTPRVYRTLICVVFEAMSKFMAVACACCVYMVVYIVIHHRMGRYAATVYFFKFVLWIWPCWRCVKPQKMRKLYFALYLTVITCISSVIYIHPFKGHGKLFYYPFYLIHFLFELGYIYLTTEPNFIVLSYYFTLKILMLSFLSVFALVNVIHKKDADTIHRTSITSERQEAEGTGEAEVWHWREHI